MQMIPIEQQLDHSARISQVLIQEILNLREALDFYEVQLFGGESDHVEEKPPQTSDVLGARVAGDNS